MPVIVQTTTSRVSGLWGRAYIRDKAGKMRPLTMDEIVVRGDVILTEQDAIVQLSVVNERAPALATATGTAVASTTSAPPAEAEVARVIAAVERGDPGAAPAAGLAGADGSEVQSQYRVDRIVESVSPAGLTTTPIDAAVVPALGGAARTGSVPSLTVDDVSASESAGTLTFTVTLSAPSTVAVTVNYTLVPDTAAAPADFSARTGTLTFAPGVTSLTIRVPIVNDAVFEANESFLVNLADATNASVADGIGVGTIVDNDARPVVTSVEPGAPGVADDLVSEGSPLVYMVQLSNASSTSTTYAFALGGGSASSSDVGTPVFSNGVVLNADGTITVPAGVTSFTVTVATAADGIDEPNETVPLSVGGVTGTSTIVDTDAPPALSINDVTVDEATGTMSFTVTLSAASGLPVSVNYGTSNGTAISGSDYTAAAGALNFAPGVISQTITLPITNDTTDEPDETLTVTLSAPINATIADGSGVGSIADNDPTPTVTSVEPGAPGAADDAVPEGTPLIYTVTLSNASASPVSYPFSLGGGSAAPGDVGAPVFSNGVTINPDGTITVPAGVTSFTVTVPTTPDSSDEPAETVPLTVGGVVAQGTITDDDAPPTLTVDDVTVNEAVGTMTFTVSLSAASGLPVSVSYATTAGSADAVTDFAPGTGTLNFAPGVVTQSITVPIGNDAIAEGEETFAVTLSAPSNATLADATGIGTIVDDDSTPTIAAIEPGAPGVADDAVPEGTDLVYTVTLSSPSALPTTYAFALGGGTAAPSDLGAPVFSDGVALNADGTITVPAGVTSFTVSLPTTQDTIDEPLETVPLTIGGVTASGAIVDDDAPPALTVDDVTVDESAGTMTFTVTLSAASALPIAVNYSTVSGTALDGSDLTPTAGTLSFDPGVVSQTITVPITDDGVFEATETFTIALDTPVNATIADGTGIGIGTIIDDEAPPAVVAIEPGAPGIGDDAVLEGSSLVFEVTLNNPSTTPTTLPFTLGGGTAAADDIGTPVFSDGVVLNADGTITIPADVRAFTVSVPTLQDPTDEANETVPLTIGGVTGVGTIIDNDGSPNVQSVEPGVPGLADDAVPEGTGLVYTVTLTNASTTPSTFTFSLGGGTAAPSDIGAPAFSDGVTYDAATGEITVPAGVTSFTVSVPTIQDTADEANETVPLTVGGVSGSGTIIDDDAPPTLSINDVIVDEAAGTVTFTVTLSAASELPVSVDFDTTDGTATSGTDYTAASGTLSFAPGVVSQTLTVPITNDATHEPAETFTVSLSAPTNATLADGSGTATITDNDAVPTIAAVEPGVPGAGDDAVPEGTPLVYTVTLTNPSSTPVVYPFTLGGGTASASDFGAPVFSDGVTFDPASGSITVPAGITAFTVSVPTTQDTIAEPNESVPLIVGGVTATGTITDDDAPSTLSISDVTIDESAGTATFTVTLSAPSELPVSVGFSTADGTAAAGADYTAGSGTLSFAPGVVSQTISLPITNDTLAEPNETFTVLLSTPTNATIADGSGVATITDNDAPPLLDLDGNDSSGALGADFATAFTEGGAPVAIADLDARITDIDSGTVTSATVTLINAKPGDALAAGSMPPGITAVVIGNVVTLSGTASLAAYESALKAVTFSNTADAPDATPRTLTVELSDGVQSSNVGITTINVIPVNDPPAAVADFAATVEDSAVTGNVMSNDSDVDGGALSVIAVAAGAVSGTVGSPIVGAFGTLTLLPDGTYSYVPAPATQALRAGDSVIDVFGYTVTDGQGATATANLTITITGTDDAPVISSGTGSVVEDTSPSTSGVLTATEVDNPALAFVAGSQNGAYGSLTLGTDGAWSYSLGSAAQALAAGQVVTEAFTVALNDGSTTTVTITVTGTDDAPVISSGSGTVTEDTSPSTSGVLTATDADNSALAFVAGSQNGAYGSLTLGADGAWSYSLGAAAQALAAGQVVTEAFTVALNDGSTTTVTITVTGTDDAPVISSGTGSVVEDTSPSTSGVLTATDVDNSALAFAASVQSGAYGSLTLGADGAWSYSLGSAAQALAAGQVVTEAFTVALNDGSTTTVTITITGTDDAPVISSGTGSVIEDTSPSTSGVLTATDVDNAALAFVAGSQNGAYGSLTLGTDGAWSYSLGAAAQALAAGQVVTEAFTVALNDGSTTTVTITITGTDDAPVISSGTGSVIEDTSPSTSGVLTATDVDNPALAFVAGSQNGAYGSLTLGADGAWSYSLGSAAQALAAGQVVTEAFTVALNDGSTTTVTITVTGTDDAPVISSGTGAVVEDTSPSTSGVLTATDVDNPALAFVAGSQNGAYGSLTLGADGAWSYSLGSAAQALAASQVVTEAFTVALNDGSTTTVTITITGTDDAPVISSGTGSVIEDTSPSTSGVLTATDVDNPALAFVAGSQNGAYGSLTLGADGAWSYSLGSAAQALAAGQVVTEAFTVALNDGSTTTVTITVTGTDDVPVISSGTGSVVEDTSPSTSGVLTATDVDNSALAFVASVQSGAYGSLTLGTDGAWSYSLGTAAQALAAGQVVTEAFTVALNDGSTTTVTITVTGTDDAPVISSGTGSVVEGTSPSTSGVFTATDVDNSALAFVASVQSGAYGSLTLGTDGAWSYSLGSAAQALAAGQVVTEAFTVALNDGSATTVTITVTGTDDAPVISSGTGAVTEDTSPSTSGVLTATDVDNPALAFVAGSQNGAYGSLTLGADGAWSYSLGSAAQALAAGQVVTEAFTVALNDGSTTTVTITVTGTDDVPVISSGTGSVVEDTSPSTSGVLTATDVDNSALAFVASVQSGAYGSLTLGTDGAWSYSLGSAAQALAAGQVVTEAFTVALNDGSTTTVTITVTGTDDAPVISSGSGTVTEDTSPSTSGVLTATDADNSALAFVAGSQNGAYGSLTLGADGAWSYSLGATAQALAAGQVVTEAFTVALNDGSTTTVTITVTGTDDAPVISSGTGSVVENTSPSTSGTLTASDVDNPALAFVASAQNGAYGSLTLGTDGAWSYSLGSAAQALAAGQVVTEAFTVALNDGSTTTVTITVTGTDDAPVISSGTGSVVEDTSPSTSGVLTATDADNSALAFVAGSQSGAYGSLTLGTDGAWSYSLGSAAQALAAGQVVTEAFTVALNDGSTTTVTITVTGTDDAPVISSGTGAVVEDTSPSTSGVLTATDVDNPALAFVAGSQNGAYGSLTLGTDGAWSYSLGSAAQALAAGQVVTEAFTVALNDGSTTTVTITVTGTDDAPVISSGTGSVVEDSSPSTSGVLTATDVDNPALAFVAGSQNGAYGSLTLGADGAWSYSLGAAAQALAAGQVVTEAFTVALNDGSTTTVTITVTGTDDAPVISSGTGSVVENTSPSTSGTLTASDVDNPALAFVASAQNGAYGSLTLGTDGAWSYSLGSAAQALAAGQVVTEAFTVALNDGSTTTVTITVTGTDDAPVISSGTGSVVEDTSPSTSGVLTATDVDNPALAFVAGSQNGAYGSLTLGTDGAWSYSLGSAAQALAASQVVTEAFTVALNDGSTTTVTITITGTDDAPVISSGTGSVIEDTSPSTSGVLTATDVDNAALAFVAGSQNGAYGSLTLGTDGAWSYSLGAAAQALAAGQVVTEAFTVALNDGSTTTVTITVTGTDDAPTAVADVGSTPEDTPVSGNVLANDSDLDTGTTLAVTGFSVAGVTGSFAPGTTASIPGVGSLVINANGSYTFTPAANYNGTVPVTTYVVSDGNGGSASATLSLSVSPVNDAPQANDDVSSTPINTSVVIDVKANDSDPDDSVSSLTVSNPVLANPSQGSVAVNPDGTISFTPATNFSGPVTITYTLTDASGASDTATVTVNVGTNTPPDGADALRATPEDTNYTVASADFGFSDTDLGQTLAAVRIDSLPANGSLLLNGSPVLAGQLIPASEIAAGHLVFAPVANASGSPYAAFTFSVQDSAGAFDPAPNTLTLNVTPVNDAPQAVADTATAVEAGGMANATAGSNPSGNVLSNDTDVDSGDSKTVSAVSGSSAGTVGGSTAGAYGSLVLNADGSYTYSVNNALAAVQALRTAANTLTDTFSYTVRDAAGATSSTTLTVTLQGANDAPVATVDTGSVAENATLSTSAATGVLANDADVDAGDSKTVSAVSFGATTGSVGSALTGTYGTLTLNADGSYTYSANRPAADALAVGQSAADVFTYTVRDAAGATSSTTLTLTVTGTNDAPTAVADVGSTPEDTPVSGNVLANDSDPDTGTTLSVSGFSVAGVSGSFAPGATASIPGVGSLVINANGSYTFTPAANYNGTVPVTTYVVSDGNGGSASATLSLSVSSVNDAPVGVADTATAVEAGGVANATAGSNPSGNVLSNDTDVDSGDSKTVSAVSGSGAGVVGGSTAGGYGSLVLNADGSYTYSVNNALAAVQALRTAANTLTDTFSYTVRDAAGATSSTTLTVTLQGANDAPVATVDTGSVAENATLSTSAATGVLANDADVDAGDSKTVSAVSFGATTGSVGSALTGTYGTLTLNADGSYTYSANRPAADALAVGQSAADVFTYTVRDAAGATSSTTLTLTVTGTNDAPTAVADVGSTPEDTPVSGNVLANDSDLDTGTTLSVSGFSVAGLSGSFAPGSVASIPGVGSLVINANGSYTFTPAANYNGTVPVATYVVSDGNGGSASATLSLSVSSVNDAPVGVADSAIAVEAGGVANASAGSNPSGNVLANDTDVDSGDSKTVSAVSGSSAGTVGGSTAGAYGSLVLNADGSYTYSVNNALAAVQALRTAANTLTDTFSYTVRDAAGATSSTTLTVTLQGANDAPVATVDTGSVAENATLSTSAATGVLANDADVDAGDSKTVSAVSFGATTGSVGSALTGTYGTLTLNADGSYTYSANRPAADALAVGQSAADVFTYTVRDAAGATSSTTLTLTVTGTNDAPTAVADVGSTPEDTPVSGNVLANDSDPDTGTTLSVSGFSVAGVSGSFAPGATASIPGVGSLVINANGSYTFTPAADYNGTVPVATYVVSDGNGGSASATLTMSVTAVADIAPDNITTLEDTPVTIAVLANDSFESAGRTITAIDGQAITAGGAAVAVSNGTVTLNGSGQLLFTPSSNFSGTSTFNYTVSSGGVTETAAVNVGVSAVADRPALSVVNGSPVVAFLNSWEASANSDTTSDQNAVTTFEGWTRVDTPQGQTGGTNVFEVWTSSDTQQRQDGGNNIVVASAGNGEDFLELNDSGGIAQTIGISRSVATQSGMIYELSFDYAGRPGFAVDYTRIGVYIDGVQLQQYAATSPQTYIDWQNLTVHFAGDGADHTILIRTDATLFNSGGRGAFVDDLMLTATQGVVAANASTYTNVVLAPYVSSSLVDTDGSESLSLSFSNLPTGATIVTASNPGGYAISGGMITISAAELASAQLHLPTTYTGHLSIDIAATATEASNGNAATSNATLELDVLSKFTATDLGGDGLTNVVGTTNADALNGGSTNEYLLGRAGNDTINANGGNDYVDGGAGNDTLNGGAGNDALWGGAGNDRMTGGAGADVFAWTLADRGTPGTAPVDTITDFDSTANSDKLDLRDLLVGGHAGGTSGAGNLATYLDFDTTSTPGSTIVRISSVGAFAGGTYAAGAEDQCIVLENVDLRTALSLGAGATDDQIIQELLNRNKLDVGP